MKHISNFLIVTFIDFDQASASRDMTVCVKERTGNFLNGPLDVLSRYNLGYSFM